MTRLLVPLVTPDVSAFTKTLKGLLDERHAAGKALPSHVELLNLLARAAGLRNFATLKASVLNAAPRAAPTSPAADLGVTSACHRNQRALPAATIQRTRHAAPTLVQHMGIDHRRRYIGMAKQLLDRADVVTALQQMRSE